MIHSSFWQRPDKKGPDNGKSCQINELASREGANKGPPLLSPT